MITQSLNQSWTLTIDQEEPIPAAVPGSVYGDLLAAGKMKDPFWRDNEREALAWMDHDLPIPASLPPSPG